MIKDTVEYQLIQEHYGDRMAKRSQVPLINHINEGLVVLNTLNSTDAAKRAFCLHPLFQADADLKENWHLAPTIDPHVMLLTMEYRNIANSYLSDKALSDQKIKLSPLYEVNEMLIADKVQNYKDFRTYHLDTHPRSVELEWYFREWLKALSIEDKSYKSLCTLIDRTKND